MSKGVNNFKKLEEEQEEAYTNNINKIKGSIDSNINSISSLTNIIDLYLSKAISYVLSMGGESTKNNKNPEE